MLHYAFACISMIYGLNNWGQVTQRSVSKLTIIGWDNGLSLGRHQAIIWVNARMLLIRISGTNFSEILSEIHTFGFKKMHFKISSAKWRQFFPSLNVLNIMLKNQVRINSINFDIFPRCYPAFISYNVYISRLGVHLHPHISFNFLVEVM